MVFYSGTVIKLKWERVRSHFLNNPEGIFLLFGSGGIRAYDLRDRRCALISSPFDEFLFLYLIVTGVESFHHFVGDVKLGVDIESGGLEKDCVIAACLVVRLDESLD